MSSPLRPSALTLLRLPCRNGPQQSRRLDTLRHVVPGRPLHNWLSLPARQLGALTGTFPTRFQGGALRSYATRRDSQTIRTFSPDKLVSTGQDIIHLSRNGTTTTLLSFPGLSGNLQLEYRFFRFKRYAFPDDTRGVFYFHHVPGDIDRSQIRFRLCDTLDGFDHGQDLRLPQGDPWNISLRTIGRAPSKYGVALMRIREGFSLDTGDNSSLVCHRKIFTFDPQKLPSMGSVIDMSGLLSPGIHVDGGKLFRPTYVYQQLQMMPHPPDTIGVYYFKQSTVLPTRLGELRFRLCHSIQEFDQGTDLCTPSGAIWHLSSSSISAFPSLEGVRDLLESEGLFNGPIYTHIASSPSVVASVLPLVLNTPSTFDLSQRTSMFANAHSSLTLNHLFRTRRPKPLFRGRVVAQLEEYPGRSSGNSSGPLLALRVLEHMTPVERLTEDDYMKFPTPGELIAVRRGGNGQYIPWGYSPRKPSTRELLISLLAESRGDETSS